MPPLGAEDEAVTPSHSPFCHVHPFGPEAKTAVPHTTWTNATQARDKASAYQVAEGMRALEKGLSGFFHLVNGTTLLVLGLAIAFGRSYPRWLGWVGAVSGLGFLAGGIVTAHTGFSPLAGTVLLGPTVLGAIFLIGAAVSMWRRSSTAR